MNLPEEALAMLEEARRRHAALAVQDEAIDELIVEASKRLEADWCALIWENNAMKQIRRAR